MFTGTVTNVATVLFGTVVGASIGRRIPDRLQQTIVGGLGLLTAALAARESLATDRFVLVLGAVLVGSVVGELLRIEQGLERLGRLLQARLGTLRSIDVELPELAPPPTGDSNRFAQGFVISSLVFCIGPLTILGSINDGLGDPELLIVKAGLDGFAAVAFAAVYGWGVGLSALTVLVVQGGIAVGASGLDGVLTEAMVEVIGATGGVLLLGVALRLLDLKQIRVANMLPALVVAPVLVAIFP